MNSRQGKNGNDFCWCLGFYLGWRCFYWQGSLVFAHVCWCRVWWGWGARGSSHPQALIWQKKKKKKKNFSPVVWFSRSFFGVPTRPKIWVHLICFALRAGLNIFGALEGQPADDQWRGADVFTFCGEQTPLPRTFPNFAHKNFVLVTSPETRHVYFHSHRYFFSIS